MIGQYLSNINESVIVSILQKIFGTKRDQSGMGVHALPFELRVTCSRFDRSYSTAGFYQMERPLVTQDEPGYLDLIGHSRASWTWRYSKAYVETLTRLHGCADVRHRAAAHSDDHVRK
jgi:hypothetical protein